MKRLFQHIFFTLMLVAVMTAEAGIPSGADAGQTAAEYDVKAAFLYNFFTFVEWPAASNRPDMLRVCVLGELPEGRSFKELDGQIVAGRKLSVRRPASIAELGDCQVLFLAPGVERDLPRIMKALEGTSILTVSDTAGFGRQGVIINFYLEKNKVRFEINAAAARRAGLTISSKLLKLAGSVYGAPASGD